MTSIDEARLAILLRHVVDARSLTSWCRSWLAALGRELCSAPPRRTRDSARRATLLRPPHTLDHAPELTELPFKPLLVREEEHAADEAHASRFGLLPLGQ
jgi:hypothetical protein